VSRTCHGLVTEVTTDLTSKRIDNAITMEGRAHKKNPQSKRKATTDKSTPGKRRKTPAITSATPAPPTPAPATPARVNPNPYARYAEFPWGSKEFEADTEFSRGRKVWGTSTNLHTRKIRESQKRLLRPLLAFERAKDWKRQNLRKALKKAVTEGEHATVTGMPIGTRRTELSDVQCGKFERLVQKTWEVMLVRKKDYILYRWYELPNEQQRFYLELGDSDEIPPFTIPDSDLAETGTKPMNEFSLVVSVEPVTRQAHARFEGLVEWTHAQDNAIAIADRYFDDMEIAEGGVLDLLRGDEVEDIKPVGSSPSIKCIAIQYSLRA